jgi:hypothetical protein
MFLNRMFYKLKNLYSILNKINLLSELNLSIVERNSLLQGKVLGKLNATNKSQIYDDLSLAEFSVFSQWGDDGVIQFLINELEIENNYFIEFGVENYNESNTRFLLMNSNWSGLVIDSSSQFIDSIKKSNLYWKYSLNAIKEFITAENIDNLLLTHSLVKKPGILSIDIDGNDYWVWKNINSIDPSIVIIEYNSLFGNKLALTVPYDPEFFRTKFHYSNLYFGASLKALYDLGISKGYSLIYCTTSGNNAYFVKTNLLGKIRGKSVDSVYKQSHFRESRNNLGKMSYLSFEEGVEIIKGLPIFDLDNDKLTCL